MISSNYGYHSDIPFLRAPSVRTNTVEYGSRNDNYHSNVYYNDFYQSSFHSNETTGGYTRTRNKYTNYYNNDLKYYPYREDIKTHTP